MWQSARIPKSRDPGGATQPGTRVFSKRIAFPGLVEVVDNFHLLTLIVFVKVVEPRFSPAPSDRCQVNGFLSKSRLPVKCHYVLRKFGGFRLSW